MVHAPACGMLSSALLQAVQPLFSTACGGSLLQCFPVGRAELCQVCMQHWRTQLALGLLFSGSASLPEVVCCRLPS